LTQARREDRQRHLNGCHFLEKANWAPFVVSDGLLITGQNPSSSGPAAKALLTKLKQMAEPAVSALAS
jgi:putative intracellular protease/amidase